VGKVSQNNKVGTFKNDTFKNLMKQYSCQRMSTDKQYRLGVLEIVAQRKKDGRESLPEVSASETGE
jgi:hypothetical protein